MRSIDSLNLWAKNDPNALYYEPLFDDLTDHVGKLTRSEANLISSYMEVFRARDIAYMGYPRDPLNYDLFANFEHGNDDRYRWSGMTHYLIETYCVDPPLEFRDHVRAQLTSRVDLKAKAQELRQQSGDCSLNELKLREWNRLKVDGGVPAAWVLYP